MKKYGKGQPIDADDEVKAEAMRAAERSEQAALMGGEDGKKVLALEPDAYAFCLKAEADGLAPKHFVSLDAMRVVAAKQGKPLSLEQLSTYYRADDTAPQAVVECAVDGKPAVARVWAIAPKGEFMTDRDSTDGLPLMAGIFVDRFDADGRPQALAGCGSPFDQNSCLSFLRTVRSVTKGKDSQGREIDIPVPFINQATGRRKSLPSMPHAKAMADVAQLSGRQNEQQSRITRLGGLVNRSRPTGQDPFRPNTPRGQRRDGGTTPHGFGR